MTGYVVTVLLSVISGTLVYVVQNLLRENDRLRKDKRDGDRARQKALADGVMNLLRIQLIEYYDRYMTDGEIPKNVYENWEDMYSSYAALGGNGTVKKMNDDIVHLKLRGRS